LDEIVAEFGTQMLTDEGRLDRARLRDRVFNDADARRRLEAILHPRIRDEMLARAARSLAPYVVFVIPLLFETGQESLVDRVLLIDVPEDVQRERVATRDQIDTGQIDRILGAQTDRATRLRRADDVIHNDASLEDLHTAVEELHRKYLQYVEN
jgi:dephospho-CoA kinase